MHTRIATSHQQAFNLNQLFGWGFNRQLGAMILAFLLCILSPLPSFAQQDAQATVSAQYIFESPNLADFSLLTHTANLRVQVDESAITPGSSLATNQIQLFVEARYRLENGSKDERAVRLTLSPIPTAELSGGAATRQDTLVQNLTVQNLTVQSNGQALTLLPTTGQAFFVDLTFQPEEQRTLLVTYVVLMGQSQLPTLLYPLEWLAFWRNNVSLRINIAPGRQIGTESWTLVEPSGWSYALSSDVNQPDLKWLYDGGIPEGPLLFQFVHPLIWQSIQLQQEAARLNAAPDAYLAQGKLYKELYLATSALPSGNEPLLLSRNRETAQLFYNQSVAAFTSGVRVAEQAGGNPLTIGQLHAELAGLYRNRTISGTSLDADYAALMVEETGRALNSLSPEDALRPELLQWQMEGLYALLQDARERQEWSLSLDFLAELTTLSQSISNPIVTTARLEEIRRTVVVQEALGLLEAGDQQSAMALAGPEIANADLQPLSEEQSLFISWQVTLTVSAVEGNFALKTIVPTSQREHATDEWRSILQRWQENGWVTIVEGLQETPLVDAFSLETVISIAQGQDRRQVISAIPDNANWAYLREILIQSDPQVESSDGLLLQEDGLRINFDLRAVGDIWSAMAARLARQATESATEPPVEASPDLAGANAALAARIRRVNYANQAKLWQGLIERSWIIIEMQADAIGKSSSRSWLATVTMPPQLMEIQASSLVPLRVSLLFVLLIVAVAFLSAFLWWLL